MRRLRLPAVLVTLGLIAPGSARADWPSVAGTTTLSGSQTGYVTVRLPQPISFPLTSSDENQGPGLKIRLRGSGRLYGAIVREVAPGEDDPAQLMMTSGDGDGDPQETTLVAVSGYPEVSGGENQPPPVYTMPAGEYRLYLIADGKPVQADITFPGLSGALALSPDVPVPQRLFALPRVDGAATPDVAEFGGESTLASPGLTVIRPHVSSDAQATARIEPCFHGPEDEPSADASAFGPGCGDPVYAGEDLLFWTAFGEPPMIPPGKSDTSWEAWWPDAQPGRWFLGGNVEDAGTPGGIEMFGAWIDYEAAPGTPLPVRPPDLAAPAPAAVTAPTPPATSPARPSRGRPVSRAKHKKAKANARRCRTTRKKSAKRRRACRRPARRHKARRRGRTAATRG